MNQWRIFMTNKMNMMKVKIVNILVFHQIKIVQIKFKIKKMKELVKNLQI
jgi:hypothetical protein